MAKTPANENPRAIETDHASLKAILDETKQLLRDTEAMLEKAKKPQK